MVQLEYSVQKPLNREPEVEKLVDSFITPHASAYDRNHGPIPHLSPIEHRVNVYGLVNQELSLSIEDLQSLPQHDVICALQCAGNRRHTMRTKLREVSGIDWFDGAVMNCRWRGPLLHEVLQKAGVNVGAGKWKDAHVAFACFQTPTQEDEWYGASIPLKRAMDPEASIMLALEMNGEALPPKHGGPVRVVTPGIAGARSVKWLDRVTVQMCESNNHYQQQDYKILPPEVDTAEKAAEYWDKVDALMEMPINSVIGVPKANSTVERGEDGMIEVKGYALPSGSDGPIARVEVRVGEGEEWTDAELLGTHDADQGEMKWAWCLWRAKVNVDKGKDIKIVSRATDKSGNMQDKCPKWNFRGVAYNGYGEVTGLTIV